MIAVEDVIYVRYRVPDLDAMERFLSDFGLLRAERTPNALYMRGLSDSPYLHVSELGAQAAGVGFGMRAASLDDLHVLASDTGARVETNPLPGGGHCVRLTDPAGFEVWVHHGLAAQCVAQPRTPHFKYNVFWKRQRHGATVRSPAGPSHVYRLGHVVLQSPDTGPSYDFYSRLLGMKVADAYYKDEPERIVGRFLRCGLGERYTDHHSIGLFDAPRTRIGHSAFEVLDYEDLMMGNAHLLERGYPHAWGVGRHVEGSQIFDYWRDPFGNKIEHWTDGDQINDRYQGGVQPMSIGGLAQWAPPMPKSFFD